MNFKPLRATLVILFAVSLVACGGGVALTPALQSATEASAPHVAVAAVCHQQKLTSGVRSTLDSQCPDCTSTNTCDPSCPPGADACSNTQSPVVVVIPGPITTTPCFQESCGPNGGGAQCQQNSSCIGYSGDPVDGQHCDAAPFAIGDPIAPDKDNSGNTTFFVTNEAGIWQNGVVIGWLYAGGIGTTYWGIEINGQASWGFGASVGINFGPISVGVNGSPGSASAVQWWDPKVNKLPANSGKSCWPKDPFPGVTV